MIINVDNVAKYFHLTRAEKAQFDGFISEGSLDHKISTLCSNFWKKSGKQKAASLLASKIEGSAKWKLATVLVNRCIDEKTFQAKIFKDPHLAITSYRIAALDSNLGDREPISSHITMRMKTIQDEFTGYGCVLLKT